MGIDVAKIAEQVVSDVIKDNVDREIGVLDEAFYASPKSNPQVTQYVTQKTKDAHDALYKGHVEAFNRASAALDATNREAAKSDPGPYRSLQLGQTRHLNSLWLHELYFANCFDPNSNVYMDSTSFLRLQAAFGSFDDWQRDFIACAHACDQGWVVCGYNTYLRGYVNTIVTLDNQDVMLGLIPVIVLDMHEHSRRDYLNDKQSYVVAMMNELRWDVIDDRFEKTEAIARIVRQ